VLWTSLRTSYWLSITSWVPTRSINKLSCRTSTLHGRPDLSPTRRTHRVHRLSLSERCAHLCLDSSTFRVHFQSQSLHASITGEAGKFGFFSVIHLVCQSKVKAKYLVSHCKEAFLSLVFLTIVVIISDHSLCIIIVKYSIVCIVLSYSDSFNEITFNLYSP